jgi:hypothetical protein
MLQHLCISAFLLLQELLPIFRWDCLLKNGFNSLEIGCVIILIKTAQAKYLPVANLQRPSDPGLRIQVFQNKTLHYRRVRCRSLFRLREELDRQKVQTSRGEAGAMTRF